jgi:hypothetical protein
MKEGHGRAKREAISCKTDFMADNKSAKMANF